MTRRTRPRLAPLRRAGLVAVLMAIDLALGGCRKDRPAPRRPAPLVTVAKAASRDVPVYIDQIGRCSGYETVAIQPQASGQIKARHFTDGADLKKGDPLFTIDPAPYQAALDQAQATLAQNEASLVLATQEFERAKKLLPTNAISKENYETAQSAVGVAEALVRAGRAQVETAEVNLRYTSIASPIEGRAGKRLVDAGNIVTAYSGHTLLVIQRLDPIYADFIVPEQNLPEVHRRMSEGTLEVRVRLPQEAQDAARTGKLTFLDNAVQSDTGTVQLRATLPNADRHFWPGQFVQVRLVLHTLHDAVVVPYSAVQIGQEGPFVCIVEAGPKAALRPVTLGQRQGDDIVITKGLRAGETVITQGQLAVVPGAPVRLSGPAPQGAPPTGGHEASAAAPGAGGRSGGRP